MRVSLRSYSGQAPLHLIGCSFLVHAVSRRQSRLCAVRATDAAVGVGMDIIALTEPHQTEQARCYVCENSGIIEISFIIYRSAWRQYSGAESINLRRDTSMYYKRACLWWTGRAHYSFPCPRRYLLLDEIGDLP
jgi:hypothetical protein